MRKKDEVGLKSMSTIPKLKFKKLHPDAVTPSKAHPEDAGFDLVAISKKYKATRGVFTYSTGLAIEIPNGYVGLIFPRSSICTTGCRLSNAVGVIDSTFRGPIKFNFDRYQKVGYPHQPLYEVGDRIGQLLIIPLYVTELEEVDELSSTDRGTGGFGSSGK